MQTAKKLEKNKYEIRIEVNSEEWEKYVEQSYEENKGKFSIQGFRKGKAPRRVIEKNYGASVFFDDALDALFVKEYNQALNDNADIQPVANPELKIEKFDENGLVLVATVECVPEVKLGAYTGLDIKKATGKVTAEQVNKEIEQIREKQARFEESNKSAGIGDFAIIDFVGSVDGVKFAGGEASDYRLELGSKTFIEGFEDQIVGMNINEKRDINVTFPENYQATELAGKKAVFGITLKKVEQKILPELNDEFASNVGEFETFEEMKKDIKKHQEESLQVRLKRETENNIIETVVKQSEVEIPESMIERQLDMFMQDFQMRLSYQGVKLEDYAKYMNTTVEKMKEERKDQASFTVKTRLVLEAIIRKENLSVTEKELNDKLTETAVKYKKSLEDYKTSLGDKNIAYVENDILMTKLIEFLTKNNNVA